MKKVLAILVLTLFLTSCTENSRAKNFGGTAEIEAPCGMMVGNITWKEAQLWYSYEPMPVGYEPVTHTFQEVSSYGVVQGKYIIKEVKCN
jgi:hypothetical protein|tara:strand:+ start:22358 stop:22627 length:270 start_codon:yes stop_codon:yes gene_type:complete